MAGGLSPFFRPPAYILHMAKTKEKPHKCPDCDYRAATPGAITQHINKEHGPTTKLRSKYGDAAPKAGGVLRADRPDKATPSGIPSLDYIMGIGGVPQGTMVEVFGPPRAGKTLTALAFSGHAQQNGGKVGFVDAEQALRPTFLDLLPNLDRDKLEVSRPMNGEQAMNITKDFIRTDEYAVWTVDSIHACVPEAALDAEFGSPAQRARLATLMSEALPVLAQLVSRTSSILVLINHIKEKPNVTHGRSWYTPGGSAPEYYSTVRLNVWASGGYKNEQGIQFGHKVKVKVEKAKMTAPHATAEFDLFYTAGTTKKTEYHPGGIVVPAGGIDYGSSWISVLKEEGIITKSPAGYIDLGTGEKIGGENEIREILADPKSDLRKRGAEIVYPKEFRK